MMNLHWIGEWRLREYGSENVLPSPVKVGSIVSHDKQILIVGVEEMFRSISTLLAAKKDRLEKEQILRKKNSVVLTAPAEPDEVQGQGYTCCAI